MAKFSKQCETILSKLEKGGMSRSQLERTVTQLNALRKSVQQTPGKPMDMDAVRKRFEANLKQSIVNKGKARKARILQTHAKATTRKRVIELAIDGKVPYGEVLNAIVYGSQHKGIGVRSGMVDRSRAIQLDFKRVMGDAFDETDGSLLVRLTDATQRPELVRNMEIEAIEMEKSLEGKSSQIGITKDNDAIVYAKHFVPNIKRAEWAEFNRLGGEGGTLSDHGVRQGWDRRLVGQMPEPEFIDWAIKRWDFNRIMGGDFDGDAKLKLVTTVRQNILDQNEIMVGNSSMPSGLEPSSRVIHLKDIDGRIEQRDMFSNAKDYFHAVEMERRGMSEQLAKMEMGGPSVNKFANNVQAALDEAVFTELGLNPLKRSDKKLASLRKKHVKSFMDADDTLSLKDAQTKAENHQHQLDLLTAREKSAKGAHIAGHDQAIRWLGGEFHEVHDATLREVGLWARWSQQMSKLPLAQLNALFGDPATIIQGIFATGGGMREFAEQMRMLVPAGRSQTDKMRAQAFGMGMTFEVDRMNIQSGDTVASGAGFRERSAELMFRYGGLEPLTNNARSASAIAMSSYTSRMAREVEWSKLNKAQRTMLERQRITEPEYNALRDFATNDAFLESGEAYLNTRRFDGISDDAMRKVAAEDLATARANYQAWLDKREGMKWDNDHWKKREGEILKLARQELGRRYDGMVLDEVSHRVMMPSEQTQDFMRFGGTKGSVKGELGTTSTQFMSFPVEYYNKVLKRAGLHFGGGMSLKGISPNLIAGQAMLSLIAGTAILASKDIVKGRKPRTAEEMMSVEFILEAMDKGGFFSIMGNLITDIHGPFGGPNLEDIGGPLLNLPFKAFNGANQLAQGQGNRAARTFFDLAVGEVPLIGAVDAGVGAINGVFGTYNGMSLRDMGKEAISPGYVERRDKLSGRQYFAR